MSTYRAIINSAQLPSFLQLFYAIDSAKGCEVKITPDKTQTLYSNFLVEITPESDSWYELLVATFKDGLLALNEWDKHFVLEGIPVFNKDAFRVQKNVNANLHVD